MSDKNYILKYQMRLFFSLNIDWNIKNNNIIKFLIADWSINVPECEKCRHKVYEDGGEFVVVVEHERVPVDGHRHQHGAVSEREHRPPQA